VKRVILTKEKSILNQVKTSLPTKTLYPKGKRRPKTRTFEGHGRQNDRSRRHPQPWRSTLQMKKQDFEHRDRIRGLYICSFVANIRDCAQILWGQYKFYLFTCLILKCVKNLESLYCLYVCVVNSIFFLFLGGVLLCKIIWVRMILPFFL